MQDQVEEADLPGPGAAQHGASHRPRPGPRPHLLAPGGGAGVQAGAGAVLPVPAARPRRAAEPAAVLQLPGAAGGAGAGAARPRLARLGVPALARVLAAPLGLHHHHPDAGDQDAVLKLVVA